MTLAPFSASRLTMATAIAAVVTVVPAGAGATTVAGLGKLSADGTAYRPLTSQGVKLEPSGDAAVTKTGVTTFLLPTTDVDFAKTTLTELGGALVLRRKSGGKTRTVRLESLQLRLGNSTASRVVSAKIGGKRIDVFSLDLRNGEYTVDAKTLAVKVGGTRASLTKAAATAIGSKLALKTRKGGAFGVLSVATSVPVAGSTTPTSGGTGTTTTPGTGTGTSTGAGGSTPTVNTSPVACTTTLPATTKNTDGTPYIAATPLARPAGAIDVTSSTLRWHPRESFIRYITGGGEGATPSGGATGGPATADGKVDFDFIPAAGSWYDRASGQGRLLFSGCITFSYTGHGINIQLSNPQIELNGSSSRVLASFTGATSAEVTGLGEVTTLELATGQTTGTTPTLVVRNAVPLHLTAWANEVVLGGFYPAPDDSFGQITVTAGLPA